MKNKNVKFKIGLKERAYRYSVRLIEFIGSLPVDMATTTITRQLVRSATNILGASILTLKGKNRL